VKSPLRTLAALATGSAPPVPYSAPGAINTLSTFDRTNAETFMRTYAVNGTIFQIVSLLATSVAQPEWRLYRKARQDGRQRYTTGDQGSDERTEVLQHQALTVWNHPNDFATGSEFREAGQQHQELTGEQIWIVGRGGAPFPMSLWTCRPDRIQPVPDREKYLAGYLYTSPAGEKIPLDLDQVIMTKFPNPLDPFRGLGPVQSVLVDIDAARYSAEWNRQFFLNSALPGGVIEVSGNLDDTDYRRLADRWREGHQGGARAHRVAILEAGQKWVPNQMTVKDMDFSALRAVSRDVLREAWGIHKSMLGNADDVNRANAQTAEEVYGRWKVIPRLDRIKRTLNEKFLPMFYPAGALVPVEFDYANPLPDDREADNSELTAKSAAWSALVTAGADPGDASDVVGLPRMGMVAKPQSAALPGANPQGPAPGADNPDDPGAVQARTRPIITLHRPRAVTTQLAQVDAQWRAATGQLAAQYQAQITPVQQQQALDQIRHAVEAGTLAALGAIVLDHTAAAALILTAMTGYAAVSAHQAAAEAEAQGVNTTVPTTPTAQQLQALAAVTAALMAAELAVSAGREAMRVHALGMDGQATAAAVQPALEALSDAGPRMHLGAAMSAAQNKARLATFRTGPVCELAACEENDTNTCDPCRLINGHVFGRSDNPVAVASADALYPAGGYVNCAGRERCRGTLTATYLPATATAKWTPPLRDGLADAIAGWHLNGHDHQKVGL
jgi:HK97 family phage portal protein